MSAPLLLLAFVGRADDPTDCKNVATTAAMRACENKRYQEADRQINVVYTRLLATLDNDSAAAPPVVTQ